MPELVGPAPHVTGISPNEGTPGTKLTIRGENLGQTASDLTHVFINQIDVGPTAQWFSSSRITAITPLGEGELDIVVVTNNGKFGTSAVSYRQVTKRNVGPQTSVTYWPMDERRYCPAIYEHGGKAGSGADSVASGRGAGGGELDPSTGLPMSELTRISIPLSESALRTIYPTLGSVQLTDKDFDPLLFLLKFYKNSNFNDLTVTYNNFRKSVKLEGLGEPINVMRTNLLLIFRCLDGLDSLRLRLISEKQSGSGQQFQLPFETSLSESRDIAHSLFKGILKRRDRAESTRNAIDVMQRYQFLFNLPHAIRSNILKGDYSLVLNDYLRAKSLFANSDVKVLSRVYGDVENAINNFRDLLCTQLTTMPIECDEAKRKVGYLLQLEVDFDPTWLCLCRFKEWLIEQLRMYQQSYRQVTNPKPGLGDLSLSTIGSDQHACKSSSKHWFDTLSSKDLPPMVALVESVCQLLTQHVVQFWRLGALYATTPAGDVSRMETVDSKSHTLSSGVQRDIQHIQGPTANTQPIPTDPKTAWSQMNLELLHLLANTMRDEILDAVGGGTKDALITNWLPQCISVYRRCCNVLPLTELPPECGDIFSRLAHDLRRHAVRGIFQRARSLIEVLQLRESWDVNLSDSDGGVTKLPGLYEETMIEALDRCRDLVSPQTAVEKPLFESAELRERFPDWCGDAMVALISTFRRLADRIESTVPHLKPGKNEATQPDRSHPTSTSNRQINQSAILSQVRGLLLILNNANWVQRHANPRLLAAYTSAGYASPNRLMERLTDTWQKEIADLASRYVRLRGPWLCNPIRPSLTKFLNGLPCTPDQAPSSYKLHSSFRTILANLSHIYSELVLLFGVQCVQSVRNHRAESSSTQQNPLLLILTQIVFMLVDQLRLCFAEVVDKGSPRPAHTTTLIGSAEWSKELIATVRIHSDAVKLIKLLYSSVNSKHCGVRGIDRCGRNQFAR
ncbi:unnamed protein product [Dicrocoelium dendriticum]|nr:unnamed protein product [Dicrocoelium dendriticum]